MCRRALFFSVILTVAHAAAVISASDISEWLQPFEPNMNPAADESTFTWLPNQAPQLHMSLDGSICVFIGQRAIEGDAWRNLPPLLQIGGQLTVGGSSWWVRPVLGYFHASGTADYVGPGEYDLNFGTLGSIRESEARGQMTADIDEIDLGLSRDWNWRWLRLDGATGAAWVRARLEDRPASTIFRQLALADLSSRIDHDETLAWWASIGVGAKVGGIYLGLAARYTYAPMQVFNRSLQAGGIQIGGTLTWAW